MIKEKTDYLEFYILKKKVQNESEIKNILRGKKLLEFVSCRPALKEMPKEVLQAEGEIYQKEICVCGVKEKQQVVTIC